MYLGIPSFTFTRFFELANKWTYKQLFGTKIVNPHAHTATGMHACTCVYTHTQEG